MFSIEIPQTGPDDQDNKKSKLLIEERPNKPLFRSKLINLIGQKRSILSLCLVLLQIAIFVQTGQYDKLNETS